MPELKRHRGAAGEVCAPRARRAGTGLQDPLLRRRQRFQVNVPGSHC